MLACECRIAGTTAVICPSMAQGDILIAFLEDGLPLENLKKLDLSRFDWSTREKSGRTLLLLRIDAALKAHTTQYEDALRTMEWMVHSGASIEQQCTGGSRQYFWPDKPEVPKIDMKCEGLNAFHMCGRCKSRCVKTCLCGRCRMVA